MRGPGEKGWTARQGQYMYDDKYLIFPVKDFFCKIGACLLFLDMVVWKEPILSLRLCLIS